MEAALAPAERAMADDVLEELPDDAAVLLADGSTAMLPESATRALRESLRMVAAGERPIVVHAAKMLTTSEAASLLGMSRQAVVDLCDAEKIDHTRTGKHRRLPLHSVLAHRAVRIAAKERALDDLTKPIEAPTVEDVRSLREVILTIVEGHGGSNVRIFGSVARGEARPGSDLDLLIDVPRGTGMVELGRIEDELNDALPWSVDVMTSGATHGRMEHIVDDAVSL